METLAPLIDQVAEIIKGTKDFAISQAPDFVRQYLVLNICQDIGWFCFDAALLYAVVRFAMVLKDRWDEWDDVGVFLGTLGVIILGTASAWGVMSMIEDSVEIWLAPKAYLVTHLISLASHK